LTALGKRQVETTVKLRDVHKDVLASVEHGAGVVAMLGEIMELTRRAAPLLDSPMAKLAQSSAASSVLGMLGKGRGRG
jgi:hypothetical protein